jgi:hypothetical protein
MVKDGRCDRMAVASVDGEKEHPEEREEGRIRRRVNGERGAGEGGGGI